MHDVELEREVTQAEPLVRALARGWCSDPDDQDELVQRTLTKAWQARAQFRRTSRFTTWVYAIARHEWISMTRHRAFRARVVDDVRRSSLPLVAPSPEEEVLNRIVAEATLAQLPDHARVVARLSFETGMRPTQIGEALSLPPGTVRARLCRARAKIQHLRAHVA